MKTKNIAFLIALFLNISMAFSQVKEKPAWIQKTYFGGNLWLSVGSVSYIEASPTVGYWITPRFTCATGFIYNYYKNDFFKVKSNIYGGKFFTRYIVIENLSEMIPIGLFGSIFAHAEYQYLSLEYTNPEDGRFGYNRVYIGGGIRQPIGEKGGVYLSVLYNLNDLGYLATSNPELRIGIYF